MPHYILVILNRYIIFVQYYVNFLSVKDNTLLHYVIIRIVDCSRSK